MKTTLLTTTALVLALVAGVASAAPTTATSNAGAVSTSNSGSVAVANPVANASANSGAANAANQQTINTTNTVPEHQTIETAPPIVAPQLTTTLTETCMGSTSVGVSVLGWGATGGTTWNDKECIDRLNARELNAMGYRAEACYVMRSDPVVDAAFNKAGDTCAQPNPPVITTVTVTPRL